MKLKHRLYNLFEKPYLEKFGYLFQLFIVFIICLNILSFSLPMILPLSNDVRRDFKIVENFTIFLFFIELSLRYFSIGIDKNFSDLKGKIKYTFNFYTIIDILVLLPYIFIGINLYYFRFIRLFRFLRFKKTIKKYFSISSFSKLNILSQILVLLILSIIIILVFSIIFHSIKTSAVIFIDPPGITEVTGYTHIFMGMIELVFGLLIGGALISIITEYLSNTIENINKGYFPYKNKDHIIIINYNKKLEIILEELDLYYKNAKNDEDIVLFLPNVDIEKFNNNLPNYLNINVFLITGDLYHISSYERLNLAFVDKIIFLKDETINASQVLKFITSKIEFKNDVKFIVEIDEDKYKDKIYQEIFEKYNYTLINSTDVVKKIIKRSIVDYNHFNLLREIFSFNGYEFYIKDFEYFFDEDMNFNEIFNSFKKGICVGIIRNDETTINPEFNSRIIKSDKLILLLSGPYDYEINKNYYMNNNFIPLQQPLLKEFKKVAIVGDYSDIKKEDLYEFLTDEAIKYLKIFKKDSKDEYYKSDFWKELDNNYDLIVLNLEDEFEFDLTLYLKSIFKNKNILNKIVNIINDPLEANLLMDKTKNIILSQDLIGKYIVQNVFNDYITQIFYELTHSFGNELYILSKENYKEIFEFDFIKFKNILLENKMIYLGGFREDEFIFEFSDLNKIDRFVVMARGIE